MPDSSTVDPCVVDMLAAKSFTNSPLVCVNVVCEAMTTSNPHFSPQLCLGVCWMSRLVRLIRARGSRGS
jgi:hypothetical protein